MFESIGMQRNASSETEGLDTLGEEYDLRRLGPLNNFFLLPASGIITFVLLFVTDLPRLLILPTLCLTYGVLGVPALLIYDRVFYPTLDRSFSDYLLLALGVLKDSFRIILVAVASGAISLLMHL